MSSHHIVREKQEPALLVLGLNNFTDDELGQLLEWSPTVIATLPVTEQLVAYGIKVDYMVADDNELGLQSDIRLIDPAGQGITEKALEFLTVNGYPAVNVVTDEPELSLYEQYAPKINLVIFHNRQKIYTVTSGYSKWKPAGESIAIMSSCPIEATGLEPAGPQSFQTVTDGFFSLKFEAPFVFIAEEI
ncbi:thiamine diphosphokinase [Mucilaginibacter terrae]|uniref:Thiamine pyrophosphokinase n=1 Tax=Mucilaginibacter terrae TaxID=1955052 RepID=A0ABU3GVX2_9SPHI|nr:thiamine diphosphokinase [Mucilaginibacter terrae]MDT3403932.1 thiamine pyrophosphokinase [Mucilaginibacter terrae]